MNSKSRCAHRSAFERTLFEVRNGTRETHRSLSDAFRRSFLPLRHTHIDQSVHPDELTRGRPPLILISPIVFSCVFLLFFSPSFARIGQIVANGQIVGRSLSNCNQTAYTHITLTFNKILSIFGFYFRMPLHSIRFGIHSISNPFDS